MNAQINNSNDDGIVIPIGETARHYNAMLLQALAQKTEQATKTQKDIEVARANLRRRDNAFRSWFLQKPLSVEETSPATAYVQHLEEIEQAPTTLLSPLPTSTQQTDTLDISLAQTRVEENWNPHQLLAELQQKSPVTERQPRITKRLSVPLEPLNQQSDHNYYASGACGLISLITTGVELYRRERNCDPKHIEISETAYKLLEVFVNWEQGFPGQSGPIPIKGNSRMETHAVTCWNN